MCEPFLSLKSQELGMPIPGIDIYWDHILELLASCLKLYAPSICYWLPALVVLK